MLWETGVSLKINYIQNSLTSPLTSVEESVVSRLWKNKRYSDNLGRRRFGSPRHLHIVSLCPRPRPPSSLLRRPAWLATKLTFKEWIRLNDEEERGRDEPADRSQAPAPSVNLSICAPRPPPPDSATTITSKSLFRYKSGKWSPTVCDGIPCSKCTEQMQRSKLNRWKGQADRLPDWTKSRHKSKIMFFYTLGLLLSRFRGASIRIRPLLLPLWILGLVLRQLARGGRMKMNTKYWILNTCFETICKGGSYENEYWILNTCFETICKRIRRL